MRWLIVFASFVIMPMDGAVAGQVEEQWRHAQDAFTRGDFTSAAFGFRAVLEARPAHAAAMYNLAGCHIREGKIGEAILWLERARRLDPADGDILHNLKIARNMRESPVVEIEGFFIIRWLRKASESLPLVVWTAISLMSLWIVIALYAYFIWSGAWRRWHRTLFISGAILFTLSLAMGTYRYKLLTDTTGAILLSETARVMIAPDAQSLLVTEITEGEHLIILDSLDHYYKVRLPNFEQGWVEASLVERI